MGDGLKRAFKAAEETTRCSETWLEGYTNHRRCSRKGVNVENGKRWCKQHTPSIVEARNEESSRKFHAKIAERTTELSALRALRDAVGKYYSCGVLPDDVEEAYEKAKEARDGK